MSLITVNGLLIGYKTPLSEKINFSIERGDCLLIKGRNGSGKSTLIKTLLGLQSSKEGNITYDKSIKDLGIAYLSQESLIDKNFPITVEELLLSAMAVRGNAFFTLKSKYRDEIKDISNRLGLEMIMKMNINDLSLGQRQRVLFARALVLDSKLLILDELTANMDKESRAFVWRELREIVQCGDKAVIVVSHDADFDLTLPNKCLEFNDDLSVCFYDCKVGRE